MCCVVPFPLLSECAEEKARVEASLAALEARHRALAAALPALVHALADAQLSSIVAAQAFRGGSLADWGRGTHAEDGTPTLGTGRRGGGWGVLVGRQGWEWGAGACMCVCMCVHVCACVFVRMPYPSGIRTRRVCVCHRAA
jgi:hypothetical protein